jgi:hypothetical protein
MIKNALRRAATAAVKLTAADLHADDDERAEGLAMVVSEVFREPVPDALMNRIRRLDANRGPPKTPVTPPGSCGAQISARMATRPAMQTPPRPFHRRRSGYQTDRQTLNLVSI